MSDTVAERIANDARLQAIQIGVELEGSALFGLILSVMAADKDAAIVEFATTNPADLGAIAKLQVRILALVHLVNVLSRIKSNAQIAEDGIRAEDAIHMEQLNERDY